MTSPTQPTTHQSAPAPAVEGSGITRKKRVIAALEARVAALEAQVLLLASVLRAPLAPTPPFNPAPAFPLPIAPIVPPPMPMYPDTPLAPWWAAPNTGPTPAVPHRLGEVMRTPAASLIAPHFDGPVSFVPAASHPGESFGGIDPNPQ